MSLFLLPRIRNSLQTISIVEREGERKNKQEKNLYVECHNLFYGWYNTYIDFWFHSILFSQIQSIFILFLLLCNAGEVIWQQNHQNFVHFIGLCYNNNNNNGNNNRNVIELMRSTTQHKYALHIRISILYSSKHEYPFFYYHNFKNWWKSLLVFSCSPSFFWFSRNVRSHKYVIGLRLCFDCALIIKSHQEMSVRVWTVEGRV